MASTLLQLVQQGCKEMGLAAPTTAAANTATDTIQMVALLTSLGAELARQYDWQYLAKEHRFSTVSYAYTGNTTNGSTSVTNMSSITGLDTNFMVSGAGINTDTYVSSAAATTVVLSQAATATATGVSLTFGQTKYTLPSDYDRQVDRTHYDKSKRWEMLGPESAQQWQWLKSSYIATGPRIRYRILGNTFQIWPIVSTADYLGFEYLGSYWVTATGQSAPNKASFTVDTDTCIFHDRLMLLGLKLKYFEIKGFDTTAFYRDYLRELDLAKAHDHGSPTLSFAPTPSSVLIDASNAPDSGYGG